MITSANSGAIRKVRQDHLCRRKPASKRDGRCIAIQPIQKQSWQAALQEYYLPTMVPLLSLSHKQREQLGEILGGVKDPERVAKRGYAVRPHLGK